MIYLDNSASTLMHEQALASYNQVSQDFFANPSSLHQLGENANQLLQQARQQIANLMGCQSQEILFTSGGTEADNWAIKGTALEKRQAGKHLITSSIEHPAVRESFKELEDYGFEVTYLSVNQKGQIDLGELKEAIRPDTTLVSIIAVNNELGSIQNLDAIAKILEDYPSIHFHVDAVQAIGKVSLDLSRQSRIDLASFSGHKFHAPRGVGFLYKKENRRIQAIIRGGGQENGLRSGTENTAGIVAMAKALRLLFEETDLERLKKLKEKIIQELNQLDRVHLFTAEPSAPHILCFGIEGVRGEVLVHALEEDDIYLSTTSACSSRRQQESSTLHAMQIPSQLAQTAVRLSMSNQTTMAEIDQFLQAFTAHYKHFSSNLF